MLSRTSESVRYLYLRIVSGHTVNTDKLARLIEQASSLTEGDAKAALNAFSRIMTSELQAGNRVHLEGPGYYTSPAKNFSNCVC